MTLQRYFYRLNGVDSQSTAIISEIIMMRFLQLMLLYFLLLYCDFKC